MRYLVTSDWHADWTTLGRSRYIEIAEAVERTIEVALSERVDAYLFLGDLTDPDTGGDSYRAVTLALMTATRLAAKGVRSIWVAGNHDVCEDGTGTTTLAPLLAVSWMYPGRVWVATQPCAVPMSEDEWVLCLPFTPASHGADAAEAVRAHWPARGRVVVAAHLMLPGIHPGSEEDMPRGREVVFPAGLTRAASVRLNGHYHARQTVDLGDGGPAVIVPGSMARLGFGEEQNEPGFLIVDTVAP